MTGLFVLACFLLAAGGTRLLLTSRLSQALMDIPGARSNHARPTSRAGGLALMGAVALAWLAAQLVSWPTGLLPSHHAWMVVATGGLAALSLADDISSLPAGWRLLTQAAMVAVATWAMPDQELVFAGALPLWMDRLAVVVLWLGFLNAYNFMDGIDGITGATTVAISAGLLLLLPDVGQDLPALPAAILGAALGFLWFNWHPARIFLGDVGSIPLGFLIGGLLITLAVQGDPVAAIILPAYYLVDTAVTLLDRLRGGASIWQAHSSHAYQRAVRRGLSHDRVAMAVGAVTLALVVLAFASRIYPLASLITAYGLAGLFFWGLRTGPFDRLAGVASEAEQEDGTRF